MTDHAAPAQTGMNAVPNAMTLSWARAGLARFGSFWAERRDQAGAIRDLQSFSDRGLGDVGLTLYDVRAIANGTYRLD